MYKKRRLGVLLILLGIGIPTIFYFAFGDEVDVVLKKPKLSFEKSEIILDPQKPEDAIRIKNWEEKQAITPYHDPTNPGHKRIEIETDEQGLVHVWEINSWGKLESEGIAFVLTVNFFLVIGIVFVLTGIGKVVFSFIPKEGKSQSDKRG